VECTPLSQCHDAGVCNPLQGGVCNTPTKADGTSCDDGLEATVNDACLDGQCVGENLCEDVVCEPVSSCHEAGLCQPLTGECTSPLKDDGAECDDDDPVTVDDRCFDGLCSGLSRYAAFISTAITPAMSGIKRQHICPPTKHPT
jgi:hypothetical protein